MTIPVSNFVIKDGDQTFYVLEDEDGDVWWGYGHWEPSRFTHEVNRWLIHTCGITDPDDLFPVSTKVDHLWAAFHDEEHFRLVEPGSNAFPVTRVKATYGPI